MNHYLLRIEGVNFDSFIGDTNDLSTVRGGSLLLLDAGEQVAGAHLDTDLETVSTGASTGVFRFAAESARIAEGVAGGVQAWLRQDRSLRHATFIITWTLESGEDHFEDDLRKLRTQARFRQLASPTVSLEGVFGTDARKPCAIDGTRPGSVDKTTAKGRGISAATRARRERGKRKSEFFRRFDSASAAYASDLDQLTEHPDGPRHPLHHKMAVFYVDGNDFGKRRRELATSRPRNQQFSRELVGQQSQMVTELLKRMPADDDWNSPNGRRIENLLWGGDEMIFVVPAWKGWELVEHFFARTWTVLGTVLEHAAGLVFCHHSADIHRMIALSKRQADICKGDRSRSLVAYQILESFDHAGRNLDKYRAERRPPGTEEEAMLFEGARVGTSLRALAGVREVIARTRLYRAVQAILGPQVDDGLEIFRSFENDPLAKDPIAALEMAFPAGSQQKGDLAVAPQAWFHLLDLWDYLPQASAPSATPESPAADGTKGEEE